MGKRSVLFVGAHPDDIDLGCSICMHDHYLRKDDITSIVLTKGEKGCKAEANRVLEESKALAVLAPGAAQIFLDFPDTSLFQVMNDIVEEIRSMMVSIKPGIIYMPTNHDTHQDHITVHQCVLAALNGSKASQLLCYETPSSSPSFAPNYFKVFDPERFDVKLQAIRHHESQLDKAYMSRETVYALAKMRAAQARYYESFAEALEMIRFTEVAFSYQ